MRAWLLLVGILAVSAQVQQDPNSAAAPPATTTPATTTPAGDAPVQPMLDPTACFTDIVTSCDNERAAGYVAVRSCLEAHTTELSSGCMTYLQARQQDEAQHCGADAARLCSEFESQGFAAVAACINQHWLDISSSCLEYLRLRAQQVAGELPPEVQRNVAGACDGDVAALCPDAKGFTAEAQCVHDNWDKMSTACHDFLTSLRGDHQERHDRHHDEDRDEDQDEDQDEEWSAYQRMMTDCASDIKKYCDDLPQDDNRAIEMCLKRHDKAVTNVCYNSVSAVETARRHRHIAGAVFFIIIAVVGFLVARRLVKRCKRRQQWRRQPMAPMPVAVPAQQPMVYSGAAPYTGNAYQPVPVNEQ